MAEGARKRPSRRSNTQRYDECNNNSCGVGVTDEDLRMVFDFLDPKGTGCVTATSLANKLQFFYPDFTVQDYKLLLNGKKRLSYEQVKEILLDRQPEQVDPVQEAFQLYDRDRQGYITPDRLSDVFAHLNGQGLTPQELCHLHSYADRDKDGKITLEDFRHIMVLEAVAAPISRQAWVSNSSTNGAKPRRPIRAPKQYDISS